MVDRQRKRERGFLMDRRQVAYLLDRWFANFAAAIAAVAVVVWIVLTTTLAA